MHAGERLLVAKDRVLSVWEQRLRQEIPAAGSEARAILINTLPAVLDQLAEAFSPDHPRRTATHGSSIAGEHGGERVRLTHFQMKDLIAEYKILRNVLFDVLEEQQPLTAAERATLNASIDASIMEACSGYAVVQMTFRDQFFAMVAHDLRNPLGAAHAIANLIVRKPSSEDVPRLASRLADNIQRADRMVQDLLDAMRIQTGARPRLDLQPCELVALVRETVEHLQAEFGERFSLVATEEVSGYMARDALRRALENLVSNAVKHGDPMRPITITVGQTHGRALLSVHNYGDHIPVEEQETIFRAFQRLTDGRRSGWGLGLALVRAVAEAHGGSVGVDSLPERGTTFVIDIPCDARPFQNRPIIASPSP
jgi:signal transduction histidine kinase